MFSSIGSLTILPCRWTRGSPTILAAIIAPERIPSHVTWRNTPRNSSTGHVLKKMCIYIHIYICICTPIQHCRLSDYTPEKRWKLNMMLSKRDLLLKSNLRFWVCMLSSQTVLFFGTFLNQSYIWGIHLQTIH